MCPDCPGQNLAKHGDFEVLSLAAGRAQVLSRSSRDHPANSRPLERRPRSPPHHASLVNVSVCPLFCQAQFFTNEPHDRRASGSCEERVRRDSSSAISSIATARVMGCSQGLKPIAPAILNRAAALCERLLTLPDTRYCRRRHPPGRSGTVASVWATEAPTTDGQTQLGAR